ncbi:AAA family ATPase [Mycobacterium riyadhense]|uniref:AAA family ATPase n=1 Tax=Mycobacterium riyadhense TaxID=486698 RepID=UPI00195F0F4D|nr:AAA family ATPase [Mycobacterium riyadhense]
MTARDDESDSNTDDFSPNREAFAGLIDQYPGDDELAEDLHAELRTVRIRQAVKDHVAAQTWTAPPTWPGTAAQQLAEGVPAIDWIVADLFPAGICQVNAQQKAGKTTLALNLVHSLLTGNQFVRRFTPNFSDDEAIGYLNLELDRPMFLSWLTDLGMKDEHERLHLYHSRDKGFGRPDLRSSAGFSWFVEWITKHNITVLVIDTLSKLYDPSHWGGGSDPNVPFNRFWQMIENLKREAGLRGIFILHHTGYSEESGDRARGASAMMDNPDVNLTYRHSGAQGGAAPDSKRWLSANGRIEPIPEFEIDFSLSGRKLFATGSANKRGDVDVRRKAVEIWEYLNREQSIGTPQVAKTKLLTAVGLPFKGKGLGATSDPALSYAIAQQWIFCQVNGTRILYAITGIVSPPMAERTVIPVNFATKSGPGTANGKVSGGLGGAASGGGGSLQSGSSGRGKNVP